jgi:membrane associated rhomboid family serine protease
MAQRSGSKQSFTFLAGIIALLWVVEAVDQFVLQGALNQYGIAPREWIGLRGIALAPFLHGDFRHLAANTVPFLVLGGMILARSRRDFVIVSVVAALVGGLGVWVFGKTGSVHIGASGVIFGYFGFLIAAAWFERSFSSIVTAVVVILLYGGLIWGVRPFQPGHVSWLGHLFGLLGGVEAARLLAGRKKR